MQVAGPSASNGFLSVRLQDLHLYRVMRLVMMLAGLVAFFNLPIGLFGDSTSFADINEVSEYGLTVFGIIHLRVKLNAKPSIGVILHGLDSA